MKPSPALGFFTAAVAALASKTSRWLRCRQPAFSKPKTAAESALRRSDRRERELALEFLEPRIVLSSFVVTTINDSGAGSLRAAIEKANAAPGLDTISFRIAGTGVHTIALASALPAVTGPTIFAGNSQTGFDGTPLIELDGTSAGPAANGLVLSGAGSVARGLIVNDFGGNGIVINAPRVSVQGCFIGTDDTGTAAESNDLHGILLLGAASHVRIGGLTESSRNVISGNEGAGIAIVGELAKANKVLGNYIGTNAAGTALLGNTVGISISEGSTANVIGGIIVKARNLISGNDAFGIEISGDGTSGNKIQGNFIGTNIAGTSGVPNGTGGVSVRNGASLNEVGSAKRGGGNVISGNIGNGVVIQGVGTHANSVQGNFIGTDSTGTAAVANSVNGIRIQSGASENLVGGTSLFARNVISGNATGRGVQIDGTGSDRNVVQGNYIGTNAAGSTAIPNQVGVIVFATDDNVIGGAIKGAGNVISGNLSNGVEIVDTGNFHSVVQGNTIGLNAAGTAVIPNARGIRIGQGAGDAIIGGTTPLAANIVSGNTGAGITIESTFGANCVIQGNFIGTLKDGVTAAGNGLHGIVLFAGAKNNLIGGTTKGAGNVIAHNGSDGVLIGSDPGAGFGSEAGTGNSVLGNRIFANGGQGIDLGPNDGPTANDAGDADTGGNNLLNKPVLTATLLSGRVLVIKGTLPSAQTFRIEFFANPAGEDEGQLFLGALTVTGSTLLGSTLVVPTGVTIGSNITATITDAFGNTSEFSSPITIV